VIKIVYSIEKGIRIMYNRIFQMWYYTVSHGQMLLRSVGSEKQYNIDIYFGDVSYIEMPTSINKIEILETTQEDIDYIRQKIGGIDDIITVLLSDSHKYYIVSSIYIVIDYCS